MYVLQVFTELITLSHKVFALNAMILRDLYILVAILLHEI
jgi:hypothetical protein